MKYSECVIIELKQFMEGKMTIEKEKYVLICVPLYLPTFEKEFLQAVKDFSGQFPDKKLVIFLLFSGVS